MARKTPTNDGRFSVTGPNIEETRIAPSDGSAISIAQNFACRADDPGVWEVRENDDLIYVIEREKDGVVTTRRTA